VRNSLQIKLLHSVDWKLVRGGHWVGRRNYDENRQSDDQIVGQVAAEELRYAFHLVEPHFPVRFGRIWSRIRENNALFRKLDFATPLIGRWRCGF